MRAHLLFYLLYFYSYLFIQLLHTLLIIISLVVTCNRVVREITILIIILTTRL